MTERLGAWKELCSGSGVWTSDYRIPGLPCRSYAVELHDGGYAVVSPGAGLQDTFADTFPGPVRFLVAPSNFHWLGIPTWSERFPKAKVVCSQDARDRLTKKGLPLTGTLAELRSALSPHTTLLELPGTRSGEVWLRADTREGIAWLVCDAIFNMPKPRKLSGRLLQKSMKSGPGLALSQLMKWGGLRDRAAFKTWFLEQLEHDQPAILVPAHGDIDREPELAKRLRALIERRL